MKLGVVLRKSKNYRNFPGGPVAELNPNQPTNNVLHDVGDRIVHKALVFCQQKKPDKDKRWEEGRRDVLIICLLFLSMSSQHNNFTLSAAVTFRLCILYAFPVKPKKQAGHYRLANTWPSF